MIEVGENTRKWWIAINDEEYSSWSVGFNPVGGGLALRVDRGITCEMHSQLFTAHCTNTPEPEDVKAIIKEHRDEWVKAVDAFIDLMQRYPKTLKSVSDSSSYNDKWPSKEHISSIFCTDLIAEIAKRAEDRFCERYWNGTKECSSAEAQ